MYSITSVVKILCLKNLVPFWRMLDYQRDDSWDFSIFIFQFSELKKFEIHFSSLVFSIQLVWQDIKWTIKLKEVLGKRFEKDFFFLLQQECRNEGGGRGYSLNPRFL